MTDHTLTLPETLPLSLSTEDGRTRILFLCSGNTCRSPMCEAAVNGLPAYNTRFVATSAGLAAYPGDPISRLAVAALEDAGIPADPDRDYHRHFAIPLREELLESCDLAVCMNERARAALLGRYPLFAAKFRVFPGELPDPFGGDDETYRACLRAILAGLPLLLGEDT